MFVLYSLPLFPLKERICFFTQPPEPSSCFLTGLFSLSLPPDLNKHPQHPQTTASFSSKGKLYFIQGKAN